MKKTSNENCKRNLQFHSEFPPFLNTQRQFNHKYFHFPFFTDFLCEKIPHQLPPKPWLWLASSLTTLPETFIQKKVYARTTKSTAAVIRPIRFN